MQRLEGRRQRQAATSPPLSQAGREAAAVACDGGREAEASTGGASPDPTGGEAATAECHRGWEAEAAMGGGLPFARSVF